MKRTTIVLALLLLASCILTGCKAQSGSENSSKVYASIYPIYYLTDRIAENGVDVEIVMPPSADPHNWEPSLKQMAELEDCALFIYNGAGLEQWAAKASQIAAGNNAAVLEVASALNGQLISATGNEGEHSVDPHFWLNPVMAKEMAVAIRDSLIELDPDNTELYSNNYSLLAQDLEQLDEEYEATLSHCQKKEFVVTHQAFGYLAQRYGLKQIHIMGISAESEPTPSRLAQLTKTLKELDIRYVFTEPFTGSRVAQVLATETGAKVLELNPIGGLTEEEQKSGADYLSLMRENLKQLKVAQEYAE